MSQWIKYLTHKFEYLSPDPQSPHQTRPYAGPLPSQVVTVRREVRAGGPSQPGGQCQTKGDPASKIRWTLRTSMAEAVL